MGNNWKEKIPYQKVELSHATIDTHILEDFISKEIIEKIADDLECSTAFAGRGIDEYIKERWL